MIVDQSFENIVEALEVVFSSAFLVSQISPRLFFTLAPKLKCAPSYGVL